MKPIAGKIYMFERGGVLVECCQIWTVRQTRRTFAAFRIVASPIPEYRVGHDFSFALDHDGRLPRRASHYELGRPRRFRRPKVGLRVTKQIMKECQ